MEEWRGSEKMWEFWKTLGTSIETVRNRDTVVGRRISMSIRHTEVSSVAIARIVKGGSSLATRRFAKKGDGGRRRSNRFSVELFLWHLDFPPCGNMLEHLKNTCAHSVTFTQRSVVARTTHRVRHKSKKKRIETSTFRERRSSSGGLFNFLVGAAFHSRARFRPFFFLFSKIRRNSCSPQILQTRPTSLSVRN